MTGPDYTTVTELPNTQVLPAQLARSYHRYYFGAGYCIKKDVLEIACGGGHGLGLIVRRANRVVGGDAAEANLAVARASYIQHPNVTFTQLDAHQLPFPDQHFDTILCYEAIYYFADVPVVLRECRRVLRPGGALVVCTTNKDWPDFNPSPYSHRYFSIPELSLLLHEHGFQSKFFGAFPDRPNTVGSRLRSYLKRFAVRGHLVPKTMKGKRLLKRLFFGPLVILPRQLTEGMMAYEPPQSIPSDRVDTTHTAIYAVAYLP